jgi:antitoxin YefM
MTIHISYTQARENLATLCDEVISNRDTAIITRRGAEDVVLISAAEFNSMQETLHLLRSPRNAERLLSAMEQVQRRTTVSQSIDELRREVGIDEPGA